MRKFTAMMLAGNAGVLFAAVQAAGQMKGREITLRLDSVAGLETVNTKADAVSYRGKKALHLAPPQNPDMERASMLALVAGSDFKDGTIEAEVAGVPITAMDETARGFIGVGRYSEGYLVSLAVGGGGRASEAVREGNG
jgi:hypothetical protein